MTTVMDGLSPLFASGQRLGRYQLLRRLAVGGMAELYLASSVGPGDFRKLVAVKRLLPQHALDPQFLRMFLDEARLMARLSHPHVPQVTDVDDGSGSGSVPYFVMEYVHGTDLRGVLNAARGPLPLEHAVGIASAVAAGLHHAHEHRGAGGLPLEIVHRDVSPSNILISFDGGVKITDFGVAKWTEQKSFTNQGQLKGKFAHMSPEQCRGEALDRRSDVFALGTLLYEMTTGHPPFAAESDYELLSRIVSRDVDPPRRPGAAGPAPLPAALESIVMRSLAREREQRYATAQELQLDLEAFAREHRLVVSPVALAGYLESLFGAQVTEWREALASGRTLADHLSVRAPAEDGFASPLHAHENDRAPPAERTATDTYARLPVDPAAGAVEPAPATWLAAETDRRAPRHLGRFIGGGAIVVGALVLVFTAIEMTSRWQQGSQGRLPAPPPSDLFGAAQARRRPTSTSAGDQLRPVAPASAEPVGRTAPVQHTEPMARDGAGAPSAPPSVRRSRGGGAVRLARRESTGAVPAHAEERRVHAPSTAAAPHDGAPGPTSPPSSSPSSSPSAVAPSAPTRASGDVTSSAAVKVWDPDSPVPP